jgi:S1-C subfamily serine protease
MRSPGICIATLRRQKFFCRTGPPHAIAASFGEAGVTEAQHHSGHSVSPGGVPTAAASCARLGRGTGRAIRVTIYLSCICFNLMNIGSAQAKDSDWSYPLSSVLAQDSTAISSHDVFAGARDSVWVLRATASGGTVTQGSAVAVSPQHLLTTCHLVIDSNVAVVSQGSSRLSASVIARDHQTDRCILAVPEPTLHPIRTVRLFRQIAVGERVYALSAPAGRGLTIAEGVVSSLHLGPNVSIIQTNAPMSPGSSGGALLDAGGNLIGIIAFRAREAPTMGFAIAVDGFAALR